MMIAVWLACLMFVPSNSIIAPNNREDLNNYIEENVATIPPIPIRNGKFFEGLIIGTFWCGTGHVVTFEGELGPNYRVDACCYSHDRCNEYIRSGDTNYRITNNRPFTAVTCDCDNKFYRCLNTVNSDSSMTVIYLYSLTNPQCFIVEHEFTIVCASATPEQPCTRYRSIESTEAVWHNSMFRDLEPPVTTEQTILVENQSNNSETNKDKDVVTMPWRKNHPLQLNNQQYEQQLQRNVYSLSPLYSNPLQPQYTINHQPSLNKQYHPPPRNEQYQLQPRNEQYQPPPRNDQYQPPPRNEQYQPPPRNEQYQPPPRNEQYQPPPQNEHHQPLPQNKHHQPPPQNGYYQPPPQNEHYQLPPQNEHYQAAQQNQLC